MSKTNELLNNLQDWTPQLDKPDELTEMIMDSLPDIKGDETEEKQRHPIWFLWLMSASSIAALWIIGIFIQSNISHQQDTGIRVGNVRTPQCSTLDVIRFHNAATDNRFSYNHIKKMIYENH